MRYYTHIAASMLFFLILAFLINIKDQPLIYGILITSVVSVFPDLIDAMVGSKHRGIGHSLLFWIPILIIITIIAFFMGNIIVLMAVLVAIVSHIVLDIVTRNGYPLFYPKGSTYIALSDKRRIKTGTKQDKAVFIFIMFLLVPALVFNFGLISIVSPQAVHTPEPINSTHDNQSTTKDNINVNIDDKMINTNTTIKKVSENETQILVQDLST